MTRSRFLRLCWLITNALLLVAIGIFCFGTIWEFSTRSYLKGFSDAVVPAGGAPEQKVEAILQWMAHDPARRSETDLNTFLQRDPEETLNYEALLRVCGTASNAFVNLADSSGVPARRLLLLDERRQARHVVAEVKIDDRWVVADPLFHTLLRDSNGRLLTSQDLKNPEVFRAATAIIPAYPPIYTYESTSHVHLSKIPWVGSYLRRLFNFVWPSWEESINWTLLLERESFSVFVGSSLLLLFAVASRLCLSWFCTYRGMFRVRLRDQLITAGSVFISTSKQA